jgi:hypothetical protein
MPTKVYLRDKTSKNYFAQSGDWVPNQADALDFRDVKKAMAFGAGTGLTGLEVVVVEDGSERTEPVSSGKKSDDGFRGRKSL